MLGELGLVVGQRSFGEVIDPRLADCRPWARLMTSKRKKKKKKRKRRKEKGRKGKRKKEKKRF